MITKIDYETSRDYKHLKELLDEGKDVIGFVTYDLHSRFRNEPDYKPFVVTDVCCFRLRNKGKEGCERYSFGVRGRCYDEPFTDDYDFDFEKSCKDLQVEYIEPKRLNVYQNFKTETYKSGRLTDFLKSLKERYTWKPSDEQINTLWDAIVYVEGCDSNFKGSGSVLEDLYSDLKKLKR